MPAISASAPGKIILLGEHAVVYERPALAVPVFQVKAKAIVQANPLGAPGDVWVEAPEIGLSTWLREMTDDQPIAFALRLAFDILNAQKPPAFSIKITSTIPLASGLGSGAAVSVAVLRAVSTFLGRPFSDEQVNALAYRVEKLHHGTPSGVDNTVVTYARPVFFVPGEPILTFDVAAPFTIVIGDTGVQSSTALAVNAVREGWQRERLHYEAIFDVIARLVYQARGVIQNGQVADLGGLMDENHACLQRIGVSSPELDRLVDAARQAGALGAKLSGGGRGGNMIALAPEGQAEHIARALESAGALRTIITLVRSG